MDGPGVPPDENGDVVDNEFWAFGRSWIGLEDKFRRHNVGKLIYLLQILLDPFSRGFFMVK